MNTGHTHTASILEGVYTAGVKANLEQGYNKGASSWSHSDIITYSGGKRAIVTFKNGKWRAK
jgi:azurin